MTKETKILEELHAKLDESNKKYLSFQKEKVKDIKKIY